MNAFLAARTEPGPTRRRPAPVLPRRGAKDSRANGGGPVDPEAVRASGHNFAHMRVQGLRESESPGPEGIDVGPIDHPLECEADRAAEQVASAFPPGVGAGPILSRIGEIGRAHV